MSEIHRLQLTDPDLWSLMGSPLHDPDIEPKFFPGSVVVYGQTHYQVWHRAIDMDGNITYDLKPVQTKITTLKGALIDEHNRKAREAEAEGGPIPQEILVTQQAALVNAPGLHNNPVVVITELLDEPKWAVPEAELTELLPMYLSPGKSTRAPATRVDANKLSDAGHVEKEQK